MPTKKTNSPQSSRQTVVTFNKEINKHFHGNYLLYLPPGYSESDALWPTIFFLHGSGERGRDPKIVKRHGIPKIVDKKPYFQFIVISPQCPANRWWSLENLDVVFEEVTTQYRIDPKRIYLTGLSMGGYASWAWAIEHPQRFAALAPVCGAGNPLEACKIKNVPTWVFHGAKDKTVPLHKSEEMVAALKACGGKVKFTVYPDAGHDSWTKTYDNPKLYEWFLKQTRQ
ncbi:MAG: prolyl oligopeptidase family serine peptidase [Candidatus Marinimicrobia bacterium]|jgi:predicted peptidase|nr:prolyl oligopeptidase family serine peptidase [Candidatus Neomarinimicrobiota bacterium]MCK9559974.1 prolyl oligopeptidase family serine peptidase [Candidatus Neomarinimicrobiota bacterium]